MQSTAIQTIDLTKQYTIPGQKTPRIGVDRLNLSVSEGSVYGFLGPNGAGKTSTIKMLLGFIQPTSGTAMIDGIPVGDHSARMKVGYLPEQPYFPKFLTVYETVKMHADLAGVPVKETRKRTEECLEKVDMLQNARLPLSKCSKGMTQRVGIATSLVAKPKLLILDEPSSGLDPVAKKSLRALIDELRNDGITLFISSHELTEMEPICTEVAVLSRGRLIAQGRPLDLLKSTDLSCVCSPASSDAFPVNELTRLEASVLFDDRERVSTIKLPSQNVLSLLELMDRGNIPVASVNPDKESLEDAFLRMVA